MVRKATGREKTTGADRVARQNSQALISSVRPGFLHTRAGCEAEGAGLLRPCSSAEVLTAEAKAKTASRIYSREQKSCDQIPGLLSWNTGSQHLPHRVKLHQRTQRSQRSLVTLQVSWMAPWEARRGRPGATSLRCESDCITS